MGGNNSLNTQIPSFKKVGMKALETLKTGSQKEAIQLTLSGKQAPKFTLTLSNKGDSVTIDRFNASNISQNNPQDLDFYVNAGQGNNNFLVQNTHIHRQGSLIALPDYKNPMQSYKNTFVVNDSLITDTSQNNRGILGEKAYLNLHGGSHNQDKIELKGQWKYLVSGHYDGARYRVFECQKNGKTGTVVIWDQETHFNEPLGKTDQVFINGVEQKQ